MTQQVKDSTKPIGEKQFDSTHMTSFYVHIHGVVENACKCNDTLIT